ncbi:hypothetical protein I79_013338 [Cricetulus griseus]|uniref:Uncharacterized protein n=1 Tax=Cricetulus griseus TaxID=10029 RepID=G3HR75_CRIGR|nr:hypothetical protein I79_013338 [Cricetulus griseus]
MVTTTCTSVGGKVPKLCSSVVLVDKAAHSAHRRGQTSLSSSVTAPELLHSHYSPPQGHSAAHSWLTI